MAVENVAHRQRAHLLDLRQHLGGLIGEFVVDDDEARRRHAQRHVAGFVD
jgi:hypothetical protein